MNINIRFIVLVLFSLLLLVFNVNLYGQANTSLDIAKRGLQFIKNGQRDSLMSVLDERVARVVKKEQIDKIMRNGKSLINNSNYPLDSVITVTNSIVMLDGEKYKIDNYSIPFVQKNNKDSISYFLVSVLENTKITKLAISTTPSGMRIMEPARTEPHLKKLNLKFKDVIWFRIWYNNGYKKDRIVNGKNYYAVSGGIFESENQVTKQIQDVLNSITISTTMSSSEKIEKSNYLNGVLNQLERSQLNLSNQYSIKDSKVKKLFQNVFDNINIADIDSIDYKFLKEGLVGDPESIYLRFKFRNKKYKDLEEFQIFCFFEEESNKKELMSDYIIIKHTAKTRYLLLKAKNEKLVEALKELAYYDYKDYYEDNP